MDRLVTPLLKRLLLGLLGFVGLATVEAVVMLAASRERLAWDRLLTSV